MLKGEEIAPSELARAASLLCDPSMALESGVMNAHGYVVIPDAKVYAKRELDAQYDEEVVTTDVEIARQDLFPDEPLDHIFPFSNAVTLREGDRGVLALALEKSGSRLLSGGVDGQVNMWDFAGMDESFKPFRSVEPYPGHPIQSLGYNASGDSFLVSVNDTQFKVFTRDGHLVEESIRGDMYLIDVTHTKGHKSQITNAVWHPTTKATILTSGADSTMRIWDVHSMDRSQVSVIKVRNRRGITNAHVTTCAFDRTDGKMFAAGTRDGTLHLWPTAGPHVRPKRTASGAHAQGEEITCIAFAKDGRHVGTRSSDGSMKLWDVRAMRRGPTTVWSDLPSFFYTRLAWSPCDRFLCTGTSVRKGQGTSLIQAYDKSSGALVRQIGVGGASVVDLCWHPTLNQVLASTTDGDIHAYYHPSRSTKGVLLSLAKVRHKAKSAVSYAPDRPIHTPHALPMFQAELQSRRQRELRRADPKVSHRPDLPTSEEMNKGKGLEGSLTQQLMKNIIRKTNRSEDPRAALLKHAVETEKNPYWFKTYRETQPENVFDYEALKADQEAEEARAARRAK